MSSSDIYKQTRVHGKHTCLPHMEGRGGDERKGEGRGGEGKHIGNRRGETPNKTTTRKKEEGQFFLGLQKQSHND